VYGGNSDGIARSATLPATKAEAALRFTSPMLTGGQTPGCGSDWSPLA
jgi:hypothetical protein